MRSTACVSVSSVVRADCTSDARSSTACSSGPCAATAVCKFATDFPPAVTAGRTGTCAALKALIFTNAGMSLPARFSASSVVLGVMTNAGASKSMRAAAQRCSARRVLLGSDRLSKVLIFSFVQGLVCGAWGWEVLFGQASP